MAPRWRTAPMPTGWARLRLTILERDGHRCTARLHDGTRCTRRATDVDHIIPAAEHGTDAPTNLASLCGPHHRAKTAREGRAAQVRQTGRLQRSAERHPGLLP